MTLPENWQIDRSHHSEVSKYLFSDIRIGCYCRKCSLYVYKSSEMFKMLGLFYFAHLEITYFIITKKKQQSKTGIEIVHTNHPARKRNRDENNL